MFDASRIEASSSGVDFFGASKTVVFIDSTIPLCGVVGPINDGKTTDFSGARAINR